MDTALVLAIPVADSIVGATRLDHDPSASDGMPTHVTLLYPFKPLAHISLADSATLTRACENHLQFELSFEKLARFPGVLWLAPATPQPVIALTEAVMAAFPECRPYGGNHPDIVPHLTLANIDGSDKSVRLDQIESTFMEKAKQQLPFSQSVLHVSLFDRSRGGRWREVSRFPLGR